MRNRTNNPAIYSRGFGLTKSKKSDTYLTHYNNTQVEDTGITPRTGIAATEFIKNWTDQKVKLKKKFINLADSDFQFKPGTPNEFIAKLEKKLGKTREELYTIIKAR